MNNCAGLTTQTLKVFVNCVNLHNGKVLSQHLAENFEGGEHKSIKIVGTVDLENCDPPSPHADIICFKEIHELYGHVKTCDVVVYDITENTRQLEEAKAIINCLSPMQTDIQCSMLILVSNVGTWAMTGCIYEDDPDLPLTEEDFRSRKPHPNFEEQLQVEKMVIRLRKNRTNFTSCVIVSGLTYGHGENIFHFIFKAAWSNDCVVPLYGEGGNILPTIHVGDLAKVIAKVIQTRPKRWYILAIDNSHSTYKEITEAVTKSLSTRQMKEYPHVDAFLNEDLSQRQIDLLSVNLKMENFIKEVHDIDLDFPGGLIENLDEAIRSYRRCRNLPILKIVVLGPPTSGKTFISQQLSRLYRAPIFNASDLRDDPVTEIMKKLSICPNTIDLKQAESDKEDDEMHKLLDEVQAITRDGNNIGDELLMKIMQGLISSKLCLLHGFIIDGFPETPEQAHKLFQESTEKPNESQQSLNTSEEVKNQWIFNLQPSDCFYSEFVLNLPEKNFHECKLTPELLAKRMSFYKSSTDPKSVIEHLEKCSFKINEIDFSRMDSEAFCKIVQELPPINCNITKSSNTEYCAECLSSDAANITEPDAEEKSNEMQLHLNRMQSINCHEIEEEKYCLDIFSSEYYRYLRERVLLRCANGIIECSSKNPKDPVEFLAKFIFGVHDQDQ